jgi:hypothetical protein
MSRIFCLRNYGVYVLDERGSPHHLPHAHVKKRGRRVASVFLLTLEVFHEVEPLPADLVAMIESEQAALLAKWVELNGD